MKEREGLKKSYSSLNILQEKLVGLTDRKGLFTHFFSNRPYLQIKLPYYEFLRGKIFCEDLRDNYKEEVPFNFDISLLMYLIFDDCLSQIKRGAKHEQIAGFLVAGKKEFFRKHAQVKRIMKPLSEYVFEFEDIEEEEYEETPSEKPRIAYVTLRLKQSELLRAEVLLHDLQPFMEDGFEITVEELITIIFLNFIDTIKKEGNTVKVQKSILAHLKRF